MSSPPTVSSSWPAKRKTRNCSGGYAVGGGNFGIVSSFTFELQPLGPTVLAGMVAWPMDDAPRVLRFLREFMAHASDEVGLMANLRLAPPLPVVPEDLHGKPIVALVATYAGPVDEGREALAPIRELPSPAFDAIVPKPYVAQQKMFDAALPHGRHYYWKSHKLGPLTDEIIDVVVEWSGQVTSPRPCVTRATGGAASCSPAGAATVPVLTYDLDTAAAHAELLVGARRRVLREERTT
jgi:hypothetical protein